MGAFRSGMIGNIKLCATCMSLCAISKMLTRVCTALVSPPELKQGSRLSLCSKEQQEYDWCKAFSAVY